jgi:hypothetical protein
MLGRAAILADGGASDFPEALASAPHGGSFRQASYPVGLTSAVLLLKKYIGVGETAGRSAPEKTRQPFSLRKGESCA